MSNKRRRSGKKRNYDIDKKKAWKKLKRKPVIHCKQMNDVWDKKKTVQQNLRDMGLAFDTNKAVKIPRPSPAIISEVPINLIPTEDLKLPKVRESMEVEAALGEKEKRFLVSSEDVIFCTHMMDKYRENYKAMARDSKNQYQLTPKQIRDKIRSFKRSKTQYQQYLDNKNCKEDPVEVMES
ncbi:nucleolar protein 16-like [Styela clava]|uniref:nucleolar protein 16-like n=1 Tax=Styela clava TaxID=7725 RepID=UPI00193AAFAA|nr:nucleolar protein 16-like [Styela clava]